MRNSRKTSLPSPVEYLRMPIIQGIILPKDRSNHSRMIELHWKLGIKHLCRFFVVICVSGFTRLVAQLILLLVDRIISWSNFIRYDLYQKINHIINIIFIRWNYINNGLHQIRYLNIYHSIESKQGKYLIDVWENEEFKYLYRISTNPICLNLS